MFPIESLRTKTILWALIPTALILVVVAIIGLYAYERVARDVVLRRDAELARISASRLAEGLSRYTEVLRSTAADPDVQSLELDRLRSALAQAQNQLYVYDAGVVVYDSQGSAVWSQPFATRRQGTVFPAPAEFDTLRGSLQPTFSNVFKEPVSSEDVILVGAPIVGSGGEFKGVLAGMFKMRYPLLGPIDAEVLQLKAGLSGFAYLVDGNGQVIYHPDDFRVGSDLTGIAPVARATRGETGALLTNDVTGKRVVSGFAPVPGTDWALVTQERWDSVIGPIKDYGRLLLALLAAGGVISATLIFVGIGRILKPIRELTRGARLIAAGDFNYVIPARSGDEVQALAQQFNTMASALKDSYSDLEQRVEVRTAELRESEERYRTLMENAADSLLVSEPDGKIVDVNKRACEELGYTREELLGLSVPDIYTNLNRSRVEAVFEDLVSTGVPATLEGTGQRKDGTTFPIEMR